MSEIKNLGRSYAVTITQEMLDSMAKGASLITMEQAHRLLSLSAERTTICFEKKPGEERDAELRVINDMISKIWNDIFSN